MSWLDWLWKNPDGPDPPEDENVPKQDKPEDEYTKQLDRWLAFDGRSGPFGNF